MRRGAETPPGQALGPAGHPPTRSDAAVEGGVTAAGPSGAQVRPLARQSLTYGLGELGGRLAALAMVPVLARALGPGDFGLMELGNTIGAACMVIFSLGMGSAVQREYFEGPPDGHPLVVSTGLWTLMAWVAVAATPVVAAATPLAQRLLGGGSRAGLLQLVVLVTAGSVLFGFAKDTIRLHFRPARFIFLNVGQGVTAAAGILAALVWFGPAVTTVYLGTLAALLLFVPAGMWSVRRDLAPVFSVPLCRRMLAFGLPLAFSIIPEWTLSLADRLFLSRYSTLAEIGQYSIAVKVASVLMLVTAGFQQAWSPYLFALLNSGTDYRPVLARVLTGLTLLLAGVGLPLTIFAPEAIRVVAGPGYERAAAAVWLLILGNVAVSLNNILAYGIAIQRKTYFFILLPGIAASTNLILNVFLIPPMGMLGAAWATAASYLLLSALYYRTSQRLIPVALPVKRVSLVLVGLATVGFLAATWPAWAVGSTLAMKSLLLAGAWALAVALLLSPDDRRRLWALAAARWPGNGRPWGA